jgi:hypothetical protein
MATVTVSSTFIGSVNDTGIYRVDISQSGLTAIQAISILEPVPKRVEWPRPL